MKKQILLAVMVIAIIYCSCNTQDVGLGMALTETAKEKYHTVQSGEIATSLAGIGVDVNRKNDSIGNANKQRMWVYQIGGTLESEEQAAAKYEKLKNIDNLYIFKRSSHEFYIIKDDAYKGNQQLIDSFSETRIKLETLSADRLDIIDLSLLCPPKENLTHSRPIVYKLKGQKKEVECWNCE